MQLVLLRFYCTLIIVHCVYENDESEAQSFDMGDDSTDDHMGKY